MIPPKANAAFVASMEDVLAVYHRPPDDSRPVVCVDEGGCLETSRPTTHAKPTYIVDGIVHYCVTNIPGAVGRTSTYALTNVTLPYALQLANKGAEKAVADSPALLAGVNLKGGKVTNAAVAQTFGLELSAAV